MQRVQRVQAGLVLGFQASSPTLSEARVFSKEIWWMWATKLVLLLLSIVHQSVENPKSIDDLSNNAFSVCTVLQQKVAAKTMFTFYF